MDKVAIKDNKAYGSLCQGLAPEFDYATFAKFAYKNSDLKNVVRARVSYTDAKGKEKVGFVEKDDFKAYTSTLSTVNTLIAIPNLALADGECVILVELLDADGNVLDASYDSIGSWASRNVSNTSRQEISEALLKLSYSAKDWVLHK